MDRDVHYRGLVPPGRSLPSGRSSEFANAMRSSRVTTADIARDGEEAGGRKRNARPAEGPAQAGKRPRGRPRRGAEGEPTIQILAAARRAFLKRGFAAASIDAIAMTAGVSKRTFYTRFASKAEVFEAVVFQLIEEIFKPLESRIDQPGSIRDRLFALASDTLTVLLTPEIATFDRILIGEAPQFPELNRRMEEVCITRSAALVEKCLADGLRNKEIKIEDPDFAARYFVQIMIRIPMIQSMLGTISADMTYARKDMLRKSIELFIDGCR